MGGARDGAGAACGQERGASLGKRVLSRVKFALMVGGGSMVTPTGEMWYYTTMYTDHRGQRGDQFPLAAGASQAVPKHGDVPGVKRCLERDGGREVQRVEKVLQSSAFRKCPIGGKE